MRIDILDRRILPFTTVAMRPKKAPREHAYASVGRVVAVDDRLGQVVAVLHNDARPTYHRYCDKWQVIYSSMSGGYWWGPAVADLAEQGCMFVLLEGDVYIEFSRAVENAEKERRFADNQKAST